MKLILLFITLFPSLVLAQAQVFPTRLTLTAQAPSSYLNLKNATQTPQKYRIELTQYQMKKDGSAVKIENSSNPLLELIKYSPKSVTLEPNEKQVVRVMATSFDGLADGDYSIYVHFIPETESVEKTGTSNVSSFKLQARIAVAVPIIVRQGALSLNNKITNLSAKSSKKGDLNVTFNLTNSTKYFVTGDLDVLAVTDKGEKQIAKAVGISSYIPERLVSTSIPAEDLNAKLDGAVLKKIKIKYASNESSGTNFELLAESELGATSSTKKIKKSSKRQ
jgi:P pilus assembly chaperone PapD